MTTADVACMLGTSPAKARTKMNRAKILQPGGIVSIEDLVEWVERTCKNDDIKYDRYVTFIKRVEERGIRA